MHFKWISCWVSWIKKLNFTVIGIHERQIGEVKDRKPRVSFFGCSEKVNKIFAHQDNETQKWAANGQKQIEKM